MKINELEIYVYFFTLLTMDVLITLEKGLEIAAKAEAKPPRNSVPGRRRIRTKGAASKFSQHTHALYCIDDLENIGRKQNYRPYDGNAITPMLQNHTAKLAW
jgi:hypothetical protein